MSSPYYNYFYPTNPAEEEEEQNQIEQVEYHDEEDEGRKLLQQINDKLLFLIILISTILMLIISFMICLYMTPITTYNEQIPTHTPKISPTISSEISSENVYKYKFPSCAKMVQQNKEGLLCYKLVRKTSTGFYNYMYDMKKQKDWNIELKNGTYDYYFMTCSQLKNRLGYCYYLQYYEPPFDSIYIPDNKLCQLSNCIEQTEYEKLALLLPTPTPRCDKVQSDN